VKQYTVTITPDDGVGAETVIKLDVNGVTPRVKELRLTAGDNGSLSTSQLPAINLELLLAAVMPAATSMPAPAAMSLPGTDTPALDVAAAPADAPPPPPAAAQTAPSVATASTSPRRGRPAKKAAAPATRTAKKTAGRKAAAAKATAKKAQPGKVRKATSAKPDPKTGRVYRTMPDDFVSTYHQASTVAAIADVYDVPRHTAQGWVNTARKRGLIAAARRRSNR
jgi:hypothetical protein